MRTPHIPVAILLALILSTFVVAQQPAPAPQPGPSPAAGAPPSGPPPQGGGREGGGREGGGRGRGGRGGGVAIQPGQECPAGMTEWRADNCRAPEFPPPSIVDYRPRSTVVATEHP